MKRAGKILRRRRGAWLPPLACALLAPLHASAGTSSHTAFWSGIWDQCYDVHLEGFDDRIEDFKRYLVKGRNWEDRVDAEKADIDALIGGTCKEWAADPNGDKPLRQFLIEFPRVVKQANAINEKANDYLLPTLNLWTKLEEAELAEMDLFDGGPLSWDLFPCSVAFTSMEDKIQARLGELRAKIDELRAKCPHGADDLPAISTTKKFGVGSGKGAGVPSGSSPRQGSDITNTQKAIDDERKAKEFLEK